MRSITLALIGLFLSADGFAADTQVTFGKISSGASGLGVTSIKSNGTDDGNGRYEGFAIVNKSDGIRLDSVKLSAQARPEVGVNFSTTTAISGGVANANVAVGGWKRPNVLPTVGASDTYQCAVSWADDIGTLPTPTGVYTFFDARYCMTNTASCTPTTTFSRYYGAGGPEWVYDGQRLCYNSDNYTHDPDPYTSGDEVILDGESSVTCTNICS